MQVLSFFTGLARADMTPALCLLGMYAQLETQIRAAKMFYALQWVGILVDLAWIITRLQYLVGESDGVHDTRFNAIYMASITTLVSLLFKVRGLMIGCSGVAQPPVPRLLAPRSFLCHPCLAPPRPVLTLDPRGVHRRSQCLTLWMTFVWLYYGEDLSVSSPPGMVTNLKTAEVKDTSIKIKWKGVKSADNYTVEFALNDSTDWNRHPEVSAPSQLLMHGGAPICNALLTDSPLLHAISVTGHRGYSG